VAAAIVREGLRIDGQRQVDLDAFVVQVVPRRHDADDARRHAVDGNDAAERAFVPAKVVDPRRVRQDADVFGADRRIGLVEQAAAQRRDAEDRHQFGCHGGGVDASRTLGGAEVDRALPVGADVLKRAIALLEFGPLG